MKLDLFQVDTFTDKVFCGNSAAVCVLDHWLSDDLMQKIAMENALAETAFVVGSGSNFEIRWFTPEIEMDLCGHATLAAAHVLKEHKNLTDKEICFSSNSGDLNVRFEDGLIHLDFPSRMPQPAEAPIEILEAICNQPLAVYKSRDYMLVFESEEQVRNLKVNKGLLDRINLDPGGVIVTAKGNDVDFVSRFFTPQASILEDPVTGSAHCSLIPFWSEKLGKDTLVAKQLSDRLGTLYCQNNGERVIISGKAVTYMGGVISIE